MRCPSTSHGRRLRHEIVDQVAQDLDHLRCLRGLHDERREQSNYPLSRYVEKQTPVERGLHQLAARAIEFDTYHQAFAANLFDCRVVSESLSHTCPDQIADTSRIFEQSLVSNDLQCDVCGRGGGDYRRTWNRDYRA